MQIFFFSFFSSDSSSSRSSGLVLDIAEVNVGRSFVRGIPLTLHRLDERRASTQTWSFAEDHRLKCRYNKLAVQVCYLSYDLFDHLIYLRIN